jgi:CBS domain containing-hemolysin-like protein
MSAYIFFPVLAALIALSALFSASEMAVSSANRLRLEALAESGDKRARIAFTICSRFENALSTILICNNLVNIAASSVCAVFTIYWLGEKYTAVTAAAVTVLIIVFGETIPKILAKKNANLFTLTWSRLIRFFMVILSPVVTLIVALTRLITKPLKGEARGGEDEAVEELGTLIDTVEDEGVIDGDRSELLHAALDFAETSASEVMTSRVDMTAIDIDDDWDEILETIDSSEYSRVPVYEDSVDNIIGVLYVNHLYKALIDSEKPDLRSLLFKPCYVYKTLKLPDVLGELRKHKMHLAVVTDEYGGSMGVITMEDVLEELVGDIWDETDDIRDDLTERAPDLFEVEGDMSVRDLIERLELDLENFDTESATVGGWTLERFGGFPAEGDSFAFEGLEVTVLEMDGLRVGKVLVQLTANG